MISFVPKNPKIVRTQQEVKDKLACKPNNTTKKAEECIEQHLDEFQKQFAAYELQEASKERIQAQKNQGTAKQMSTQGKQRWSKPADNNLFSYDTSSESECTDYSTDDSSNARETPCTAIYNINDANRFGTNKDVLITDVKGMGRLTREYCQDGEELVSVVTSSRQQVNTCAMNPVTVRPNICQERIRKEATGIPTSERRRRAKREYELKYSTGTAACMPHRTHVIPKNVAGLSLPCGDYNDGEES